MLEEKHTLACSCCGEVKAPGHQNQGLELRSRRSRMFTKHFQTLDFWLFDAAHESLVVTHAQMIQREAQPRWCFSSCGCHTVFHQCAPRVLVNTCPGKHKRAKIKHTEVCIKGPDKQRGLDCVQWHFHMKNGLCCGETVGPRLLFFLVPEKFFFF